MHSISWTAVKRRLAPPSPHTAVVTIVATIAIWASSRVGLGPTVSLLRVFALVFGAYVCTMLANSLWRGRQTGWRLSARVCVQCGVITVVMYGIGWGPTVAVGLLFGVVDNMHESGSKVVIPAIVVSVVGIFVGQVAIATGVIESLIAQPLVHVLAGVSTLAVVLTIFLLGRATADKERAEGAARAGAGRFRALVQNASDIIMVVGTDGNLAYVSPAFERILGYPAAEACGTDARQLIHEDDIENVSRSLDAALRMPGDASESASRAEVRLRDAAGAWHWFDASISNLIEDARVGGIVANLRDIEESKAISDRLAHAAIHDSLTGLPNRTVLIDRLRVALNRLQREPQLLSVIFLDIDHFKFVNDSLGHVAGDELLAIVAGRLSAAVRPSDTVARFGGDEFVILCDGMATAEEIIVAANRLAEAVARPVMLGDQEISVTASLGIRIANDALADPDELLRDADAAMYRAKELGRERIELFDEHTARRIVRDLKTKTDLHHALARREFVLWYQPIVELRSGRVTGFEALLRWNHSTRGIVLPADFVPLLEESGLIVPIGLWVLEEACRQTVKWQASRPQGAAPLSISVNLAPRQLAERSFPSDLESILKRTGIDPGLLVLELTESVLMNDLASVGAMLESIRELGVLVAIDDFGTGYSSLARIKRLPLRSLKIDQSFVKGLGVDPDDLSIVTAIVSLSHSLGLAVVAEGVETEQQLAELRTLGCDYGQGYLFGRPKRASQLGELPADDLVAWLTPAG